MIPAGTLVQCYRDDCIGLVIEKHEKYNSIYKIRWADGCDEWLSVVQFEVLS